MKSINLTQAILAGVMIHPLFAATSLYTVQDAGTFPSGPDWVGSSFESGDVDTRDGGDLSFHGYGGSAVDFAYGFTNINASNSGSGSLIDGRESYSLAVGDTLQIQTLVGGFNVGPGGASNPLNQIVQIGLTTSTSGSAFVGDSLFLSGFEEASTTGMNVDLGLGFRNESGAIGDSIGTATQTHSFAATSNNFWLLGLSFTRNDDDSISWGLGIDEIDGLSTSTAFGDTIERFTGSGTLTAAEHGLSTFDDLNVAFGYDIVDRSVIAVTGVSYDFDDAVPDARLVLVPEPTTSGLMLFSLLGFVWHRRKSA